MCVCGCVCMWVLTSVCVCVCVCVRARDSPLVLSATHLLMSVSAASGSDRKSSCFTSAMCRTSSRNSGDICNNEAGLSASENPSLGYFWSS